MKSEDAESERRQYEESVLAEDLARADKAEIAEAMERELGTVDDSGGVIAPDAPTSSVTTIEVEGLLTALINNHAAIGYPMTERNVVAADRARAGNDRKMAAKDRRREALNDPPGVVTSTESAPRITSNEYAHLMAANERDVRADRLDRDADERDAMAAQIEGGAANGSQQGRESAAEDRASAAEDRQMAAKDRSGSLQDHLADDENCDVAALERGRAASKRDRLADERDRTANERDQARSPDVALPGNH